MRSAGLLLSMVAVFGCEKSPAPKTEPPPTTTATVARPAPEPAPAPAAAPAPVPTTTASVDEKCVKDCVDRRQMEATGIQVIEQKCRQECAK